MRVFIDFRPALRDATGVGRYLRSLVGALADSDNGLDCILFSSSLKDRVAQRVPDLPSSFTVLDRKIPVRILNFLWHNLGWPTAESFAERVDITHSPTPLPVPSRQARRVITVHDIHFLKHPEDTAFEIKRDYARLAASAILTSDAIIVPSRATADELAEIPGTSESKVWVIPHGVDEIFTWEAQREDETERVKTMLNIPSEFLLFVGRPEPRKNLQNILKAFRILLDRGVGDLRLVIAGPPAWGPTSIEETAARLSLSEHVILTGYLDTSALARLYRAAAALVYASKCEGFGFPLVEAMACGCPIVTSCLSAMPEVAGEAAFYCQPDEPKSIAEATLKALSQTEEVAAKVELGKQRACRYSWAKAARSTVDLYRSLL